MYTKELPKLPIRCFCNDSFACDETKLIQCSNCKKKQHITCVESMKKLAPYICVYCQFLLMDLLKMPADVILEPIKVSLADTKPVRFEVKPNVLKLLTKTGPYQIEIRGLRLCNIPFKNAWPHFGDLSLNGSEWTHTLTLPEREQSRKRKDEPFDISKCFFSNKKSHVLSCKKKPHPINQPKNEDKFNYVVAVFLVYNLQIPQIVEYYKLYELDSFLTTCNMIIERLFPTQKEDDIHVLSDEIKIPMTCPVTYSKIQLPAKGYQ